MKQMTRFALAAMCLWGLTARAQNVAIPAELERTAGVGVALGVENGIVHVVKVLADSPAAASRRISEGDRVIAVGQGEEPAVPLAGKVLEECVDLIRGEVGTVVRLTVAPEKAPGWATREVILTRDLLSNPLGLAFDGTFPQERSLAPELRYTPLGGAKETSLAESLRGKVVVVQFWATWCAPSQEAVAELQKLAAKHAGARDRVVFLTVSIDGDARGGGAAGAMERVTRHVKSKNWSGSINGWAALEGRKDWHVTALPLVYVVGTDGRILAADPGLPQLAKTIETALKP